MKKLQKGFSLVELLVVVAIIGVLAGVGIVGYQSYTDSAKERVAIANLNSVHRFIDTELTLLNNNIQTTSGAINSFSTNCAGSTTAFDNTDNTATHNLGAFLAGFVCYFDVANGYGNAFENPYSAAGASQVSYNSAVTTQGTINVRLITAAEVTALSAAGATVAAGQGDAATCVADCSFIVTYYTAATTEGTAGDVVGRIFTLN